MKKYLIPTIGILSLIFTQLALGEESWSIQTSAEWKSSIESSEGLTMSRRELLPHPARRVPFGPS